MSFSSLDPGVGRPAARRFAFWSVLLLVGVLLSGCTSLDHRLTVTSWGKLGVAGTSYSILDVSRPKTEDSPALREATALLKHALAERGLRDATAGAVPDFIVELDYGISPRPGSQVAIDSPAKLLQYPSHTQELETTGHFGDLRNADGTPNDERTFARTPNPLVASPGFAVSGPNIWGAGYENYLRIAAWKNPRSQQRLAVPLWSVIVRGNVQSGRPSRGVSERLAALVAAGIPFLGTNSGGPRWTDVDKNKAGSVLTVKSTERPEPARSRTW